MKLMIKLLINISYLEEEYSRKNISKRDISKRDIRDIN